MLGMMLFIISEIMVFGAFFTAYFFIRVVGGAEWPAEGDHLPKLIAGFNTAILVSSSATIHYAQESIKANNRRGLQLGMVATFLLGADVPLHPDQRVRPHRLLAAGPRPGHDLLRPHGPARRPRHDRPRAAGIVTIRSFRGHFSAEHYHGMEVPGHLLALRRRHVARRVLHRLHHLRPVSSGFNPLRNERDAFRVLLYVIAVFVVAMIVALVFQRARRAREAT